MKRKKGGFKMPNKPRPYDKYRHFKGNMYQILAIAEDSEDASEKVVYQALYGNYKIYVRDMAMFLSRVDHMKYPEATQEYRFQLWDEKEEEDNLISFLQGNDNKEVKRSLTQEEEAVLPEVLSKFLDSDSYEEKLNILSMNRSQITEDILNTIAVSLDLELKQDGIEEKFEELKNCLLMLEKFECNRLR